MTDRQGALDLRVPPRAGVIAVAKATVEARANDFDAEGDTYKGNAMRNQAMGADPEGMVWMSEFIARRYGLVSE